MPCTKIEIIATDFHEETSWIYRVKEFKAQHLGKMQQILAVYASYYLSAECVTSLKTLFHLLFTSLLFLINSFHFVFIVFNSTSLITPLSLFTPRVFISAREAPCNSIFIILYITSSQEMTSGDRW